MRCCLAACCVMAAVTVAEDAGNTEAAALKSDASARSTNAAVHANVAVHPHVDANADASADADADANENENEDAQADVPEEIAVGGDLPVYVVRAGAQTRMGRTVFLTGSCTHPLTYVNVFRRAAAEHGGLVALQGDRPCGDGTGGLRRWSPDTAAISARIDAALRAAGMESASDVTVIGYSQGAERAEWLARRYPEKYTRFVLMAGPIVPSATRFAGAHGVVTLAGYGDVRENMASGAKRLRRDAIPAVYMEVPGIQHGELSPAADAVVASALDWLDANASAAPRTRAARGARGARGKRPRAR